MSSRLAADKELIVVPAGGLTGTTLISFYVEQSRSFQVLFQQSDPLSGSFTAWTEVPSDKISLGRDDPPNSISGSFSIADIAKTPIGLAGMAPGQIMNFKLLRPNPDTKEGSELAHLQVIAVLDTARIGKPNFLIDDAGMTKEVGGTYYFRELKASVKCMMVMRLSKYQPVTHDTTTGAFVMAYETDWKSSIHQFNHQLEATPIDPGMLYWCVIRLIDETGAWWEFLDGPSDVTPFMCKRRQVTVAWEGVRFTSVDGSDADTNIRFQLLEGDNILAADVLQHFNGVNDGDVRATDPAKSAIWWRVGPKAVDDGTRKMWVDTWGTEFGGFADPSEHTRRGPRQEIYFPTGRAVERVIGYKFSLYREDPSEDFRYGVDVQYSIEYVP